MKYTTTKFPLARVLRGSTAFLMALIAIGLIFFGTGASIFDGLSAQWGTSPTVALTLLQAELSPFSGSGTALTALAEMLFGESAYLNYEEVATTPYPTDTPIPVPTATPDLPDGQLAPDLDDIVEEPITTAAPEDIVARTLIPSSTQGYDYADDLYLYNRTDLTVDLAAIAATPVDITLGDNSEPQVLIIHTHGTEAYTQDGTDIYVPSDPNTRTTDENYNVMRVGDEIERVFTEMGLSVIHDKGLYDYPQYDNAYDRSGTVMEEYLTAYPSIQIVLDIHRDALVGEDGTVYKTVTEIDGTTAAQVMLVIGSSEGGYHPDWEENLTLAVKIQQSMNTLYPTLARPMTLRSSVYNQQLSTGALLVEVGCHGNTLQEALTGAQYFARAAGQVLLALK